MRNAKKYLIETNKLQNYCKGDTVSIPFLIDTMEDYAKHVVSNRIEWIHLLQTGNTSRRSVCHYLNFLSDDYQRLNPVEAHYNHALYLAKKIGGRKFHNANYGGGIAFQGWDTGDLEAKILTIKHNS